MLIRFYGKAIPNKVASAFPRRDLQPDGKHASFSTSFLIYKISRTCFVNRFFYYGNRWSSRWSCWSLNRPIVISTCCCVTNAMSSLIIEKVHKVSWHVLTSYSNPSTLHNAEKVNWYLMKIIPLRCFDSVKFVYKHRVKWASISTCRRRFSRKTLPMKNLCLPNAS